MNSGRKRRVVISCVTFETAKITDPIEFYQATHVHLIRFVKDPAREDSRIYVDFFERVCEIIKERSPIDITIVEHNEKVYDFTTMLRTVLNIIQSERAQCECDIYVNISAGTSEYAAAAAIASMMVPGTIPFSVGTKEFTVQNDELRDIYYEDGKPVGLTRSAKDPYTMPCYAIRIPDEHLVRGLRILHERNTKKMPVSGTKMILALKEAGIWFRGEYVHERRTKTDPLRSEAVYYQRDFINKWLEKGWIKKNELNKRYEVTDAGKIVLDTFYTDPK